MSLPDVVDQILPSVVALGSRLVPTAGEKPLFPTIVGTGFVVDSCGIVVTNHHVADVLVRLPQGAAVAIFFVRSQDASKQGVLFRGIRAFSFMESFLPSGPYYGSMSPDLAFLQVDVRDAPALQLNREPNVIRIGQEVAVAGFPLGDVPLVIHGQVSQLTATVRRGIISSVYPCPCRYPDGFTLDVTLQGGNSGSPVFLTESGLVVGLIHANVVNAPNIAMALPSNMVAAGLDASLRKGELSMDGIPTWESLVAEEGSPEMQWDELGKL